MIKEDHFSFSDYLALELKMLNLNSTMLIMIIKGTKDYDRGISGSSWFEKAQYSHLITIEASETDN